MWVPTKCLHPLRETVNVTRVQGRRHVRSDLLLNILCVDWNAFEHATKPAFLFYSGLAMPCHTRMKRTFLQGKWKKLNLVFRNRCMSLEVITTSMSNVYIAMSILQLSAAV